MLVPSFFSRLPCSRLTLTLMSFLLPYVLYPHLVHVSLHLVKFSSPSVLPPTVRSLVVLGDGSKKYIIPLGFFPNSLFLFFLFCHLGGVILICGVRICKVAISIVQYCIHEWAFGIT